MASFKPRVDKTKLYMDLGVPFHVDAAMIKSCYKRMALQYHPDKHVSAAPTEQAKAAEKFQAIALAFEVLSDERKRAAYDAHGMAGVQALEAAEAEAGCADEGGGRSGGWRDGDWGDTGGDAAPSRQPATEQSARCTDRERAFRTYREVFGHNPVADLNAGAVHNMASQRGGGSFDDVQRKRLDDLFRDMRVETEGGGRGEGRGGGYGGVPSGVSGRDGSGGGAWAPSKGRYSGQGWNH